jgi:hypothetical protein
MKIISTNEKSTKKDYVDLLNDITEFYNQNGKIKITQEICDFVVNLGGFGKSTLNKRFCVYFCSCLFQVITRYKRDIWGLSNHYIKQVYTAML